MGRCSYVNLKIMVNLYIAIFGLLFISQPANASNPISFYIEGEVIYLDDFYDLLGRNISVGDTVTGTFTYDLDTPDTNYIPTVGDYWHYSALYGINVQINGLTFKTDGNNPQFLVEVVNDHGIPASDNFLLRSYRNVFDVVPECDPNFPWDCDTHISWQLDDPSLTAIDSTDLPTSINLDSWQQIFALSISATGSDNKGYFIRAVVNKINRIPESTIPVNIDIKPGSDPNSFNNNGKGVIPVAILGSADFDVIDIDPETVILEGLTVKMVGKNNKFLANYEDVNGDSYEDLVLQIADTIISELSKGCTTAKLSANLNDGTPIEGADDICIVP